MTMLASPSILKLLIRSGESEPYRETGLGMGSPMSSKKEGDLCEVPCAVSRFAASRGPSEEGVPCLSQPPGFQGREKYNLIGPLAQGLNEEEV